LSAEAIFAYTTYGYIPGPLTIYNGIYKLQPGHRLELARGRRRSRDTGTWNTTPSQRVPNPS